MVLVTQEGHLGARRGRPLRAGSCPAVPGEADADQGVGRLEHAHCAHSCALAVLVVLCVRVRLHLSNGGQGMQLVPAVLIVEDPVARYLDVGPDS
jgi:hypothetical protein